MIASPKMVSRQCLDSVTKASGRLSTLLLPRHARLLPLSAICLLASMLYYTAVALSSPTTESCVDTLFPHSLAKGVIEHRWENFHDYYVPPAIYRGPPTPEREASWDSLCPYGILEVSKDVATAQRGQEDWHWIHSAKDKGDKVLAVPGVVLQMSCLKSIRQYVYREVNQTIFTPPSRDQVDQCIEILRDELMCKCDTTPYLIVENSKSHRGVVPVMGNTHLCRNYEKIMGWASRRFIQGHEDVKEFL